MTMTAAMSSRTTSGAVTAAATTVLLTPVQQYTEHSQIALSLGGQCDI